MAKNGNGPGQGAETSVGVTSATDNKLAQTRVKVTVLSLSLAKFLLRLGPQSADGLLAAVDEHWPGIGFSDFRSAFALSMMLKTNPSRVRMFDGMSPHDEAIDPQEWLDQAIVLRSPSLGSA